MTSNYCRSKNLPGKIDRCYLPIEIQRVGVATVDVRGSVRRQTGQHLWTNGPTFVPQLRQSPGLEPSESCTILCGEIGKHLIEGIAVGFVPGIIQRHRTLLDEVVTVESADAAREMRRLAREHGIFVGPSSGAHLIAARELRDRHKVEHVVTFFCDEGDKYINDYWL